MSAPLIEQQLAEIRSRLELATVGPWEATVTGVYAPQPNGETRIVVEDDEAEWYDLDFAAHARTDVPALLGEVNRLRARSADLVQACRSAAVLMRSVADRAAIGQHANPGTLRQAASSLDDIAGGVR